MKFAVRTPFPRMGLFVCLVVGASCTAAHAQGYPSRNAYSRASLSTGNRIATRNMSQAPGLAPAPEPPPEPAPAPVPEPPMPSASLSSPSSSAPVAESEEFFGEEGDSCDCTVPCDTCGGCVQQGLWYGSVDYLLARPRFSQAVGEVRRTLTTDTSVTPNTSTLVDQSIQFPFKYQSSFRASLGYRLLSCGGDVQFAYWRLNGSAQISDGPQDTVTDNPFIQGQLKNDPANGQFFHASAAVTANVFDVDFAKCLSLGGPQSPCDTCACPRWDLRWSAGVRAANVNRSDNNASSDPNGTITSTGNISARFSGAGPRAGVQFRRYFGPKGGLALYAKASQALLIGNFRESRVTNTPGSVEVPTQITAQYDSFGRMVPVTDIELGGSWQVAPFTYISAGWFFQCWWDLGQGESIVGSNFGPLDSANILSFDGLFIRGEMYF